MIKAKILADSISEKGNRLTTFEVTFPRFELASLNTHRAFSRNGASLRAIPIPKMIEAVRQGSFIPLYMGKHQPGMGADTEVDKITKRSAKREWLEAAHDAANHAEKLFYMGVSKELCNRLLEPFLWQTCIVSGTDFDNWFKLRCTQPTGGAQKEISYLADAMLVKYNKSKPKLIRFGGWHIPMCPANEYPNLNDRLRVSTARCARISYLTHDVIKTLEQDIERFRSLRDEEHWSPFEHQATPSRGDDMTANFNGWVQLRHHRLVYSL